MSSSYNRVTIMGNLAKAPELRYLSGGETAVVEVAIAVNERFKKDGEIVETVSFIDTVFWGRTAEVVNEYLKKGSPILVEGRLKQDRWEKEGQKRSKLKVVCEKMKMIGSRRADDQDAAQTSEEQPVGAGAGNNENF